MIETPLVLYGNPKSFSLVEDIQDRLQSLPDDVTDVRVVILDADEPLSLVLPSDRYTLLSLAATILVTHGGRSVPGAVAAAREIVDAMETFAKLLRPEDYIEGR